MSSPSLRATRASFSFHDAVPLFADATFHLERGWTGLVGPNGAGKTTLLRVLSGELPATAGSLAFEPRDATVLLCEQRVDAPSPQVLDFAERWDGQAPRLRAELSLEPEDLARWPTLSPGERKRWQIAAALFAAPQVLLLDEPQNHLDAGARAWLLGALRRHRGVGVIVSHDRVLLAELTTRTLRIDRGALTLWTGAYPEAKARWEQQRASELDAFVSAKEERARMERRLHDKRQALEAASRNRSAGRRMKSRYDSDARGLLADYRVEQVEKRFGRQVAAVRRATDRAREHVATFELDKELGRNVFAGYAPCPRPNVLHLEARTLTAGGRPLLPIPSLQLGRADRVHLAGPNGAGKTTLLRALLDASNVPEDRLLLLPQDTTADEAHAALEQVRAHPKDLRGRILSLVAALGVDPDRLLASQSPSPGEARKLLIAEGLARHVWALVLDEPTNHLDLPSIERLQAALGEWPGALLLVTHDDALAEATCETRWRIEEGALRVETAAPYEEA